MIHPKIKKTIIALHITAVLNIVIGLLFLGVSIAVMILGNGTLSTVTDEDIVAVVIGIAYFSFIAVLLIGIAVFIEIVIHHLKQQRYWAWIAAIVICGINLPSMFFVLGLIGLIGLANKAVAKHYIHE